MRIAALGDLHVRETVPEALRQAFADVNHHADVLVLCGDLTDHGLPREAEALAEALAACRIPAIAVLGNHDYESGPPDEFCKILSHSGLTVLSAEPWTLDGVGFVGAKGFGGGFGRLMLQPWGEPTVKQFVQDAVNEAVILERALARLKSEHNIERAVAVLHYAPIRETVEGEPLEVIPFLGSSRLADPLDRLGVAAVVHAHAHHGALEGRTPQGIPVYNVSLPVLRQANPDQTYRIIEVPGDGAAATPPATAAAPPTAAGTPSITNGTPPVAAATPSATNGAPPVAAGTPLAATTPPRTGPRSSL